MISAVFKALDVFADRAVRRLFWLGVFGALLIQILLALILSYLIAQLRLVSLDWGVWGNWLEWSIDLLSGAAVLFLVWLTFPGTVGIVTSFLLERVAARVEARHYPGLLAPREQGIGEAVRLAVNFALISLGLNLLALPIYFFLPIINLMRKLDPLARRGEDHAMLADDISAPQSREADLTGLARTGKPVPAPCRHLAECHPASPGGSFAQCQCRARRGICLHAVMHLDDFDIPTGVETVTDALDESRQKGNAEAHIGGKHDWRALRGTADRRFLTFAETGRADHMGAPGRGGEPGVMDRRFGTGELNDDVALLDQGARILRGHQPEGLHAGDAAEILPDLRAARLLHPAGEPALAAGLQDRVQQQPTHTSAATDHTDADGHLPVPPIRESRKLKFIRYLVHSYGHFWTDSLFRQSQVAPVVRTVAVWCACPASSGIGHGGALFKLPNITYLS